MIIAASFDVKNPELWVNRGLSYGDGLFETMRLAQNRIPLLAYHLKRLAKGLNQLQLNGFDRLIIDNVLLNKPESDQQAVVKLLVFRANQARTYTPLTRDVEWLITLEELPQTQVINPLKMTVSAQAISQQPLLAGIKHLSRLEQVMLAAELNQLKKIDDLLLVDAKSRVIESSYQNVVMIKDQQLFTPKLNKSGVKGVALQWLKNNYVVKVKHIKVEDLNVYDGMMVCNSIRGFRMVALIEQSKKQCISFGTKHHIHDKITAQWNKLFDS